MPKPTFIIEGDRVSTLEEFYDEVERVLIPGVAWGRNLDALSDILRGGGGTPEGGFVLVWRQSGLSRQRLGYAETVRQLELRAAHGHPSLRQALVEQLEQAKRGRGSTVFDWLVEIIQEHGPGDEEAESGVDLRLE